MTAATDSAAPATGGAAEGLRITTPLRPRVVRARTPYALSIALGLASMAAAGLTVADPSLLTGVAVSNGNMLGTAVVVLVVGVPVLAAAIIGAARGSARAAVIWLGTLGYLLYQAVLFCFATPLNNLFLLYVAYLGLGVWTIVAMVRGVDLAAFHQRLSAEVPIRRIAGYALVVAGLNALAWLTRILPATFSDHPRAMLTDSGLLTNPVYIQDLAIWLPVLATAAVAAWRHRTWGELTTGAMLALFVLESISIAVDQWFGSHADPTSSVSSLVMVPIFAVVAVATAVPVVLFLRNIDRAA